MSSEKLRWFKKKKNLENFAEWEKCCSDPINPEMICINCFNEVIAKAKQEEREEFGNEIWSELQDYFTKCLKQNMSPKLTEIAIIIEKLKSKRVSKTSEVENGKEKCI